MFNKPTNLTFEEFTDQYYKASSLLCSPSFDLTKWVDESDMTHAEKEAHPEYKTTGGYLKAIPYKEACQNMWNGFTPDQKDEIKNLPNFDKEVFKEITGIEVESEE